MTGFAQVEREELLPLSVAVDVQRLRDARTWEKYASLAEKPRNEPWSKVTTMLISDIQSGKERDEGFVPTMTDVPYHQHEPKDILGLAGPVTWISDVDYSTETHLLRKLVVSATLVGGVVTEWNEAWANIDELEPCI